MTSTAISQYNQAATSVPEEALLGSLVWYTLSEVDIPYETARSELERRNLDTRYLKPIRPIDAFRLSTQELKHSFPVVNGVKLNIMVRNVGQDNNAAYRQIVCERVSTKAGQRRKLTYDPSAELIYHRGTRVKGEIQGDRIEVIKRTPHALERDMTDEQRQWLDEQLDALPGRFQHMRTHLGSHKVRNFVREYLQSLDAIAVRESGGVYFVRQSYNDELEKLGSWVHSIGSSFHSTPLLDLVNQREMLAQAFEEEAIKEVRKLSGEIDHILKDSKRTVREKTFDDYSGRAAELISKARNYQEMLDIRSEIAESQIEQFKQKTMQLLDRIEYTDKKSVKSNT